MIKDNEASINGQSVEIGTRFQADFDGSAWKKLSRMTGKRDLSRKKREEAHQILYAANHADQFMSLSRERGGNGKKVFTLVPKKGLVMTVSHDLDAESGELSGTKVLLYETQKRVEDRTRALGRLWRRSR